MIRPLLARLAVLAIIAAALLALRLMPAAPPAGMPELGAPPPAVLHDFNPNPEPPPTSWHGGTLGGGSYAP